MFQLKKINPGGLLARTVLMSALVLQVASATGMVKQVIHKVMPSVVEIHILDNKGSIIASGSGFIISSNGLVATNYHVIRNATRAVAVLSDKEEIRVVGVRYTNEARDIAILQVDASALPVAALGDSDGLEVGDDVVAIGAPLGIFDKTVTTGIVSNIRDLDGAKWIQHTAAISPGNSGGPLLNSRGNVVGMNTMYFPKGQSLYFAVPVNSVKTVLAHLPTRLTSLQALAAEQQAVDKQRQADLVKKLFYPYEDPDGLFHVALPKAWQTERTVTQDEHGNVTVLFIAYDPRAGQAKPSGFLSAGIRLRFVIPAKGHGWNDEAQDAWMQAFMASVANSYGDLKATQPKQIQLSGHGAIETFVMGTSKQGPGPQLESVILLPASNLLMAVEISIPADQEANFQLIHEVFVKSFELATK